MFPFASFPQHSVNDILDEYDYIILGGGTAGCVLANRLSINGRTVLLVERGGVGDNWISRNPLLSQPFKSNDARTRSMKSTPQKHVNNRSLEIMGGNSLGGGSNVNAMLYTRGIPAEYNAWQAAGRSGWGYNDLKPLFVQSETDLDQHLGRSDDFHGLKGEWINRSHAENYWVHTPFITQATTNLGIPYTHDLNSPFQSPQGCAKMHFNIDQHGHRSSTFTAFLPVELLNERRDYLHVCTHSVVETVNFKALGSDIKAKGVTLRAIDRGQSRYVKARREIIVSAGSLGSPQVLMLSGIGPAIHLKGLSIPVVKDLPGVGSHLQDHVAVPLQFRVPLKDSMIKLVVRPWTIIWELLLYLLFGMGLLLGPSLELSIFIQSRLFTDTSEPVASTPVDRDAADPRNVPNIEIMPIASGDPDECKAHGFGGLALFVVNLRPTSMGSVRLSSSDPLANPLVDLNFFAMENDWAIMRKALKIGKRIQKEINSLGYAMPEQHAPISESNEDLDEFIRKHCWSTMHYTSTCRMAPEKEGGVVDDRLRVHGVQGLRVADASIFPEILSTHLAAPVVVVAEKCAAMIKEDHGDA